VEKWPAKKIDLDRETDKILHLCVILSWHNEQKIDPILAPGFSHYFPGLSFLLCGPGVPADSTGKKPPALEAIHNPNSGSR